MLFRSRVTQSAGEGRLAGQEVAHSIWGSGQRWGGGVPNQPTCALWVPTWEFGAGGSRLEGRARSRGALRGVRDAWGSRQRRELGENRGKEKLHATPPRNPQSVRSVLGGEVWTVWTPTSSVLPKGGLEAGGSNSGR